MKAILFIFALSTLQLFAQEIDKRFEKKLMRALIYPGRAKKILDGKPAVVKQLIDRKYPFVAHACMGSEDNPELIEYVLGLGVKDVNLVNEYGTTGLHYVAKDGFTKMVDFLLKHGADMNISNSNKTTPVHYAVMYNQPKVLKQFIDFKDKDGNPVINLEAKNEQGMTPLVYGLFRANDYFKEETVFSMLIEAGADVNSMTETGETALHHAAAGNFVETTKTLIKKKADLNAANKSGYTPLYYAAKDKALATAKILLESGAKVDKLAMELAESDDNKDLIKLMKKHKK